MSKTWIAITAATAFAGVAGAGVTVYANQKAGGAFAPDYARAEICEKARKANADADCGEFALTSVQIKKSNEELKGYGTSAVGVALTFGAFMAGGFLARRRG